MFYFSGNTLQNNFLWSFFALCVKNKRILRSSHTVCLSICSFVPFMQLQILLCCYLLFLYQVGGLSCGLLPFAGKKRCIDPFHSPTPPTFLLLFLALFKSAYSLRLLCLSVRPSAYINSAPTGQIFVKFYIRVFHKKNCR
jgi:hypothetical protein